MTLKDEEFLYSMMEHEMPADEIDKGTGKKFPEEVFKLHSRGLFQGTGLTNTTSHTDPT